MNPVITHTSVYVDDQAQAPTFYTTVLGFVEKTDIPLGDDRWLTVVSSEDPDGVELLLEPSGHPAVRSFKDALVADGIPLTMFGVADVDAAYAELTDKGVRFTQPPTDMGAVRTAVLDDTCGNLIQLTQMLEAGGGEI